MSAKARFLKRMQQQQPCRDGFANRGQADIAEFRQRMDQLQEQMEAWLAETDIHLESHPISLSECLIGGGTFTVPGISLRYENRRIYFTPVFLYAHGVTGGVDVTLSADGQRILLRRLFMRSAEDVKSWTSSPPGKPTGIRSAFSEDAFFGTIERLLP